MPQDPPAPPIMTMDPQLRDEGAVGFMVALILESARGYHQPRQLPDNLLNAGVGLCLSCLDPHLAKMMEEAQGESGALDILEKAQGLMGMVKAYYGVKRAVGHAQATSDEATPTNDRQKE